jgi:hypothetical protein
MGTRQERCSRCSARWFQSAENFGRDGLHCCQSGEGGPVAAPGRAGRRVAAGRAAHRG